MSQYWSFVGVCQVPTGPVPPTHDKYDCWGENFEICMVKFRNLHGSKQGICHMTSCCFDCMLSYIKLLGI